MTRRSQEQVTSYLVCHRRKGLNCRVYVNYVNIDDIFSLCPIPTVPYWNGGDDGGDPTPSPVCQDPVVTPFPGGVRGVRGLSVATREGLVQTLDLPGSRL